MRDGKGPLLASGQLQLIVADGFRGLPEAAPFDCIHVGAAPVEVPPALKEQLKPGAQIRHAWPSAAVCAVGLLWQTDPTP